MTENENVRERLARTAHAVLGDARNYPKEARPHLLGRSISPLAEAMVNAILAEFPELTESPAAPEGCSNPKCPLRRAHSGPCAPDGWSTEDRQEALAEAERRFDGWLNSCDGGMRWYGGGCVNAFVIGAEWQKARGPWEVCDDGPDA